jgi:hypothetical protein
MQLPEKYKENFDVLSGVTGGGRENTPAQFSRPPLVTPDEGPSLETSKLSLYFSGSFIPINESLLIDLFKRISIGTGHVIC